MPRRRSIHPPPTSPGGATTVAGVLRERWRLALAVFVVLVAVGAIAGTLLAGGAQAAALSLPLAAHAPAPVTADNAPTRPRAA